MKYLIYIYFKRNFAYFCFYVFRDIFRDIQFSITGREVLGKSFILHYWAPKFFPSEQKNRLHKANIILLFYAVEQRSRPVASANTENEYSRAITTLVHHRAI